MNILCYISFSKDIDIFFFLLESDIWLEATMATHSLTKLWRVGWKMFLWVEEKFSQNFLRFRSPSRVAITLQLKLSLVLPRTDFLCITQFPASLPGSIIDIFIKFYKLFFNNCCKKFFELVLKIRCKKCRLFDLNMKFKLWSVTK